MRNKVNGLSNPLKEDKIAVFLDFQAFNQLDKIGKLIEKLREMGRISRAVVYIDQKEIDKVRGSLPEIAKLGIEPIVTIFSKSVKATLDIVEYSYREDLTVIALGWKHLTELTSPLLETRERKNIWLLSENHDSQEGVQKLVDRVVSLENS